MGWASPVLSAVHFFVGRAPCTGDGAGAAHASLNTESGVVVLALERDCPAASAQKLRLAYLWALESLSHANWLLKVHDDAARVCVMGLTWHLARLIPSPTGLAVHGRWAMEHQLNSGQTRVAVPRGPHVISRAAATLAVRASLDASFVAAGDADVALGLWLQHAAANATVDWTFGQHMQHVEQSCAANEPPYETEHDQLMIVARAGDEIVWAGEALVQERGRWEVVSATMPRLGDDRLIKTFVQDESVQLDSLSTMWQFQDRSTTDALPVLELRIALAHKMMSRHWRRIVTHGPYGEDGQPRHRELYNAVIDIAQRLGLTRLLWVFAPAVSNRLAWSPELAAVVDATYGDHLLSYNCVIGGLRKLTEVDPVPHGLDDSIWSPGGWPDRAYMRETMLPLAGRLAGTDGDVLDVGYMAFNADDAKLAHLLPERWFSVDPLPHAIDENRSGRLLIGTVAELAQQTARRFAVIIEYGVLGCRGLQGGWSDAERATHLAGLLQLLQPNGSLLLKADLHTMHEPSRVWQGIHATLEASLTRVSVVEEQSCRQRGRMIRQQRIVPTGTARLKHPPMGCFTYEYSHWKWGAEPRSKPGLAQDNVTPNLSAMPLAVLVLSEPTTRGQQRRHQIRSTWAKAAADAVHFFVGRAQCGSNINVAQELASEPNLVVLDSLLHDCAMDAPQKLQLAYAWALRKVESQWLLKVDDAATICMSPLIRHFAGSPLPAASDVVVHGGWVKNITVEGNMVSYPHGVHIMSRAAAAFVRDSPAFTAHKKMPWRTAATNDSWPAAEDVAIGCWLDAKRLKYTVERVYGRHMADALSCASTEQRGHGRNVDSTRRQRHQPPLPLSPQRHDQLMIVAHADDEVIWAGDLLANEPGRYEIVSVVEPWDRSAYRMRIFLQDESLYLDSLNTMWQFEDHGLRSRLPEGPLRAMLARKLRAKSWSRVVFHNAYGEYGHTHHIQIHRIIAEELEGAGLSGRAWTFEPQKTRQNQTGLRQAKMELIAATYDERARSTPLMLAPVRGWIHEYDVYREVIRPYNVSHNAKAGLQVIPIKK